MKYLRPETAFGVSLGTITYPFSDVWNSSIHVNYIGDYTGFDSQYINIRAALSGGGIVNCGGPGVNQFNRVYAKQAVFSEGITPTIYYGPNGQWTGFPYGTVLRDPLTISGTQIAVAVPGYTAIAELAAGVTQTGASFLFNTPQGSVYSTPDTTAVIWLALASTDDTTDTTVVITISGKQMAPGIQHDATQDFDGLTEPGLHQAVVLHARDISQCQFPFPGFDTGAKYLALSVSRLGADPSDVCTVPIRLISCQMGFAVTHGQ
jgi:hypothetical protein